MLPGVDRGRHQRGVVEIAGGSGLEHDRLPPGLVAPVAAAALGGAAFLAGAPLPLRIALVDEPAVGAAAPVGRRAPVLLLSAIGDPALVVRARQ